MRSLTCFPSPHGKSQAYQFEALEAAQALSADVAYLDPPYNQHKYVGNYHIWESLVRWDKPEVYGVACKRITSESVRACSTPSRLFERDWSTSLPPSTHDTWWSPSLMKGSSAMKHAGSPVLAWNVEVLETDFGGMWKRIGIHNPTGRDGRGHPHTQPYLLWFAKTIRNSRTRALNDSARSRGFRDATPRNPESHWACPPRRPLFQREACSRARPR